MSGHTHVVYRGREAFVGAEFDADEARVIANALERDGLHAEAAEWRATADAVEGYREAFR